MSREAIALDAVRLLASQDGCRLWRNNVGASRLENGSFVRWGLANETAAENARVKSGDLIGIRPVTITPAHLGMTLGLFVSREVKRAGWRYRGDAHEQAQQNWIDIVRSFGGDAGFTTGEWVRS